MKRTIFFLLITVLLSSFALMAQVGSPWLIGGNNLTAGRTVGSNNNFSLGFKTNNIGRGTITNAGLWGIGIGITNANVAPYNLKLRHGLYGFDIQNSATGDDWELWTSTANGNLNIFFNGSLTGSFSSTNGTYTSFSDQRLKTNIRPLPSIMEKINQLKPSTYEFKKGGGEKVGFIAQDVMEVFPSLVSHVVEKERDLDVYTLDYSGFGVIAIKGIQELQQTISKQDQTIQGQQKTIIALGDRVAQLEASLNAISNNLSSPDMKGVSLLQNQPNPFSQITNIRYTVPQGAYAQIRIYDATGNMVKIMRATENGQIQINAYELKAGTYTYTLVVNGNVAASKQMVMLR